MRLLRALPGGIVVTHYIIKKDQNNYIIIPPLPQQKIPQNGDLRRKLVCQQQITPHPSGKPDTFPSEGKASSQLQDACTAARA